MPLVETTEHNDESLLLDVADATLFGSSQRNLRLQQQQQQQQFLESANVSTLNSSSIRCNPPPTSLLSFPSKASSKTVMTDVSAITTDFQDIDLMDGDQQHQQEIDMQELSALTEQQQQDQTNNADTRTTSSSRRRHSGGSVVDRSPNGSVGTPPTATTSSTQQQSNQQFSQSLHTRRRRSGPSIDTVGDQSTHSYTTNRLFQEMSEQTQIAHLQLKVKKLQQELNESKDENSTLLENFEQLQSLCNDLLMENARLKGLQTLSEEQDQLNAAASALPPLKLPGDDDAILPVEEYTPGCSNTSKNKTKKEKSRRNSNGSTSSEHHHQQDEETIFLNTSSSKDLALHSSSNHINADTGHSFDDDSEFDYEVNPPPDNVKHHHTMRRASFVPTPQHQLEDLDIDKNSAVGTNNDDNDNEEDLHIDFVHNRKPTFVQRSKSNTVSAATSQQSSNDAEMAQDDTKSVQSLTAAAAAPLRWLNPFSLSGSGKATDNNRDQDDISSCRSLEPTTASSTSSINGGRHIHSSSSNRRYNEKNGYNEKLDATWNSLIGSGDTHLFSTAPPKSKSKRSRRRGSGAQSNYDNDDDDDAHSILSSATHSGAYYSRTASIGNGGESEPDVRRSSSVKDMTDLSSPPQPPTSSSSTPPKTFTKKKRWSLPNMLSLRSMTNNDEDNTTNDDDNNPTGVSHHDDPGITSRSNASSLTNEEDKSSLLALMTDDDNDEEASTESMEMPLDRTAMPGIANHMTMKSSPADGRRSCTSLEDKSTVSFQDDSHCLVDEISVHSIQQQKSSRRIQQAQIYQEHSQGYL